ncbi:MAG: Spy/CpxP family protein refolding chaperone [Phycisphaerae bacterium]
MWKKIAPLLVVLSVALNIAFISVWAIHGIRGHWFDGGRCARDSGKAGPSCPLHRRLDVTDEQWKRIEPRIAEFRTRSQKICGEMNRLRTELIDLIASDNPDRQAIAAKQEEIRAGQQRMQQLVVEHLLAEKDVLTAEQQKKLFDLIRQRSACHGPGGMMGLSGAGASPGSQKHHPQE